MRFYDKDESTELNADDWQLDLLKLNPSYVGWRPHEDYMCKKGQGWDSRVINATWGEFGPWKLDEYNECVNFYFSVIRASKECPECGGNGYHKDAQKVVNSFYAHMNERGEHWNDKITQDEVQALMDSGRLSDFTRGKPEGYVPTAAEVNAAQNTCGFMGHDGINRWILTNARLERLGLPVLCDHCGGDGSVFVEPAAHVTLTLWMLHPRKGCSRGVEIERVDQADLPAIFEFLQEAAERNAQRFSAIAAAKGER